MKYCYYQKGLKLQSIFQSHWKEKKKSYMYLYALRI